MPQVVMCLFVCVVLQAMAIWWPHDVMPRSSPSVVALSLAELFGHQCEISTVFFASAVLKVSTWQLFAGCLFTRCFASVICFCV